MLSIFSEAADLLLPAASSAAGCFVNFVQNQTKPPTSEGWTDLGDYYGYWLECGKAASACGESYVVYMQTLLLVVGEWQENPDLFNYRPTQDDDYKRGDPECQRVVQVTFDPNCGLCRLVFDQTYFEYKCHHP